MKTLFARGAVLTSLLITFILCDKPAAAQRPIERGTILNPLANAAAEQPDDRSRWFTQVGGWGAFGSYGLGDDPDHAWYQQLGAYMEIFRKGNKASLAFTSQIEFIADLNNDINFNPRAIFWEEGLLYTHRFGSSYLQVGYYHRCKHDIDNLEIGAERSLIFGSIMSSFTFPLRLLREDDVLMSLQYDHYTVTWDRRTPAVFEDGTRDWDSLIASLRLNASWRIPLRPSAEGPGDVNVYIDGYGMTTFYGNGTWFSGMLRAEIAKKTENGEVRFGVHAEHLGDTGIPVVPVSGTLIGVGIRVMTAGSVR